MNSDGRSTSQQLYIPVLLVVGGWEVLVARCQRAAQATSLGVKTCALSQAPAEIAYRRPLAIVVPNRVFATASDDLEALARDVRSVLFPVDTDVTVRELEAMFAAAVAACATQRERRGGAGRYSIIDGFAEEAPYSRRGEERASYSPSPPSSRVQLRLQGSSARPSARDTVPPSSRAALSARQMLPRVTLPPGGFEGTAVPEGGSPDFEDADLPSPVTEPPISRAQPVEPVECERPSYAALKAVFSSR